jgi:hypothetical protein
MEFQIVGQIGNVEIIAKGKGIREIAVLRARYGLGNWRKRKGLPTFDCPMDQPHWPKCIGMKRMASAK